MTDIVPGGPQRGSARRPFVVVSVLIGAGLIGVAALLFVRSTNESGGTAMDAPAATTAGSDRDSQIPTTTTKGGDGAPSEATPTARAARPTPASAPRDDLAAALRTAEQFVTVAQARDCEALLALMSANTLAWLDTEAEDGRSGRDDLCEGLATEEIPPMKVLEPAREVPGGVIVELESDGDVEPLMLVLESGSWKVDLLGTGQAAATEYAGPSKQADLRNGLTAEKVFYTDEQRYTDELDRLEAIEPSLEWTRGVADDDADRAAVYVAVAEGGQVVCLSAIDYAGVRYMIKDSPADGVTYAKGDRTPRHCDAAPLDSNW